MYTLYDAELLFSQFFTYIHVKLSSKSLIKRVFCFFKIEWNVVVSCHLWGLCGTYRVYVAVTGHGWQPSSMHHVHVYCVIAT